jgi:hypothetical protein
MLGAFELLIHQQNFSTNKILHSLFARAWKHNYNGIIKVSYEQNPLFQVKQDKRDYALNLATIWVAH